jgi:hypothetical protein
MYDVAEFLALDGLTLEASVEADGEVLSAEQLRSRFEEALLVSQICTVRRDSKLVAYAMLHQQSETCWFVTCFNTHPSHRTAPVLLELFSEFDALVQRFGITELRTNVYKTNQLSLSFHKRLGFRITRENSLAVEMFTTVAEMAAARAIGRTFKRLRLPNAGRAQS